MTTTDQKVAKSVYDFAKLVVFIFHVVNPHKRAMEKRPLSSSGGNCIMFPPLDQFCWQLDSARTATTDEQRAALLQKADAYQRHVPAEVLAEYRQLLAPTTPWELRKTVLGFVHKD